MFQRQFAAVAILLSGLTVNCPAAEHRAGMFAYDGSSAHYLANDNQQLICDNCGRPTLLAGGSPAFAVAFGSTAEPEPQVSASFEGELTKTRMATNEPIATVYFKFGSSVLSTEAKNRIRQAVVSQSGPFVVAVDGFTCRIGSHLFNKKLSVKRAKAVAAYLRSLGVQVAGVEGRGEHNSLGGRLKNDRRAVIRVTERIFLNDTP